MSPTTELTKVRVTVLLAVPLVKSLRLGEFSQAPTHARQHSTAGSLIDAQTTMLKCGWVNDTYSLFSSYLYLAYRLSQDKASRSRFEDRRRARPRVSQVLSRTSSRTCETRAPGY